MTDEPRIVRAMRELQLLLKSPPQEQQWPQRVEIEPDFDVVTMTSKPYAVQENPCTLLIAREERSAR